MFCLAETKRQVIQNYTLPSKCVLALVLSKTEMFNKEKNKAKSFSLFFSKRKVMLLNLQCTPTLMDKA